jgi:hypothetical protein
MNWSCGFSRSSCAGTEPSRTCEARHRSPAQSQVVVEYDEVRRSLKDMEDFL